jgi:Bacterial low temperature requirement A protein (LtrA)
MSEVASRPRPVVRRMSGRDPGEAHRASTPLELLFDLTFVVAVARAGIELRDALAQGHAGHALAGYAAVFFALWWAWVNFTWFASAYDTDDMPYRLLTLLQMAGVLVFAAGPRPGIRAISPSGTAGSRSSCWGRSWPRSPPPWYWRPPRARPPSPCRSAP